MGQCVQCVRLHVQCMKGVFVLTLQREGEYGGREYWEAVSARAWVGEYGGSSGQGAGCDQRVRRARDSGGQGGGSGSISYAREGRPCSLSARRTGARGRAVTVMRALALLKLLRARTGEGGGDGMWCTGKVGRGYRAALALCGMDASAGVEAAQ